MVICLVWCTVALKHSYSWKPKHSFDERNECRRKDCNTKRNRINDYDFDSMPGKAFAIFNFAFCKNLRARQNKAIWGKQFQLLYLHFFYWLHFCRWSSQKNVNLLKLIFSWIVRYSTKTIGNSALMTKEPSLLQLSVVSK